MAWMRFVVVPSALFAMGLVLAAVAPGCATGTDVRDRDGGRLDGTTSDRDGSVPPGDVQCGGGAEACCAGRTCEIGLRCGTGDRCCVQPGGGAACDSASDCCRGLTC